MPHLQRSDHTHY